MKYRNIFFIVIVALGFIITTAYVNKSERKIAYVKVGALYDEFEMKKELENTYMTIQKGRQQQLDSLELELKLLDKKLGTDGAKKELLELFDAKKENYLMKKQQFEEDNSQMQEQFTSKIKKQLNQYVSDYGKEKEYDYILGAEGSGAVMYAKDKDDVTNDVLVYINNRFKGLK